MFKRIRSNGSFDAFNKSVLEKMKAFNGNIGDLILKRKTQAPTRYSVGKTLDEHPITPTDNYSKVESLLLGSLTHEIESLGGEINYVSQIYDEIDVVSLPARLGLLRTMTGKKKALNVILTAVRNFSIDERLAIS